MIYFQLKSAQLYDLSISWHSYQSLRENPKTQTTKFEFFILAMLNVVLGWMGIGLTKPVVFSSVFPNEEAETSDGCNI